jgi:hypothetical protein
MTQEQIKLKNIISALQNPEYKKYDYKSIGMVIHYLKAYGFVDYDVCTIGDGQINRHGEVMAQFKWDADLRLPIFTFGKKYDFMNNVQQIYLRSEEILTLNKNKTLTVDEALEKYIKEKYDQSLYQVLSIGMDDVKEFAEYYLTLKNK